MSRTAPVIMLYSCVAAVSGLLVYFVNVDVGHLYHEAVLNTSVPVVNTFDHLSSVTVGRQLNVRQQFVREI